MNILYKSYIYYYKNIVRLRIQYLVKYMKF